MKTAVPPSIVWFRDDLRLADHPALAAAAEAGRPLLCIYVLDGESAGLRPIGAASRWWLHYSLAALAGSLQAIGGRLDLFAGPAADLVGAIIKSVGASGFYFNRRYQPGDAAVERDIEEACASCGVPVQSFQGSVLYDPSRLTTQSGRPFKVFGPYQKAALAAGPVPPPIEAPRRLNAFRQPASPDPVPLESLRLLPRIRWDRGLEATWRPGEADATARLHAFAEQHADAYAEARNRPGSGGSSRLSPHLRFGEISPRQVHAELAKHRSASSSKFLGELLWRDFATSLLFHHPDLATHAFHQAFEHFPYRSLSTEDRDAWRYGRTGIPIVDAGMRELWTTGFMHNRVRMITASFLVKHLLADWRIGEAWFWDTLCDADPANNPVNWQWIAGCGNDPSPFFRIFNPVLQGEKFDPDGAYVKAHLPELGRLPARWIHKPWAAPASTLGEADVTLGLTYPHPIIDLQKGRDRALATFRSFRLKASA